MAGNLQMVVTALDGGFGDRRGLVDARRGEAVIANSNAFGKTATKWVGAEEFARANTHEVAAIDFAVASADTTTQGARVWAMNIWNHACAIRSRAVPATPT